MWGRCSFAFVVRKSVCVGCGKMGKKRGVCGEASGVSSTEGGLAVGTGVCVGEGTRRHGTWGCGPGSRRGEGEILVVFGGWGGMDYTRVIGARGGGLVVPLPPARITVRWERCTSKEKGKKEKEKSGHFSESLRGVGDENECGRMHRLIHLARCKG